MSAAFRAADGIPKRDRIRFIISRNRDMHIHILGICGTFMGGVALLARAGTGLPAAMPTFIRR